MTTRSRIRTIIADDEPEGLVSLRTLLERDDEIEIVAECASGPELEHAIAREPHLLILDVQMPGMTGLEAVKRLPGEGAPVVVFVTAHDRYATKAFEVAAVDYVLKPYTDARFHEAIGRAKRATRARALDQLRTDVISLARRADTIGEGAGRRGPARSGFLERLTVRSGRRVTIVKVADVDWIQAVADYLRIHVRGKRHLLRGTMDSMERQLDPRMFTRVHRSTIVNIGAVTELRREAKGECTVVLSDGASRPVSERGRANLARQFDVRV